MRRTFPVFRPAARPYKLTSSNPDEVLFEFVVQGNVVKATAIHAATGTEASIVGPANSGRAVLAQAALRKLQYVMAKKML